MSKSSTVMLPVVLGLCWWWMEGRWRWRNAWALAPFLLISGLASGWTIWEEKVVSGAMGAGWAQTWPERCIIAGKAIWFYFFKLLWPEPLILIYPRWRIDGSNLAAYLPIAAAVVCSVVVWRSRHSRARPVFFAWSYFVSSLFPVLGFFDVAYFGHSFVADHFQYLACMGPLALAGSGITLTLEYFGQKAIGSVTARSALLLPLGMLTWRQSTLYADAQTLYEHTLVRNPNSWMARNNLANLLAAKGEVPRAVEEYRAALAIRENYAEAQNNLGNTLLQIGRVDEAMPHLRHAPKIQPVYPAAENNMGNALLQKGEVDEAIRHYEASLRGNPNDPLAHSGLGVALAQKGRAEEARRNLERAVEIRPDFLEAHFNLANLCVQTGREEEAIRHLEAVLRLRPGFLVAQNTLAWILATSPTAALRNGPKALELAEQAARASAGRDPVILNTLATAQAECGRFPDAVKTLQSAEALANAQGNATLAAELQEKLSLYKMSKPFREIQNATP